MKSYRKEMYFATGYDSDVIMAAGTFVQEIGRAHV